MTTLMKTPRKGLLRRRTLLSGIALLPLAARAAGDPVVIGVSGPLTGQYAQYGADWKRGFDLALAEVNGVGRDRRPLLEYGSRTASPTRARPWRSPRSSSPTRAS